MPYFSIYAPISGHPSHYYTITLIGFSRGLVIKWTQETQGWCPHVIRLGEIDAFNGSRLMGYHLVSPETIDSFALEAMTGKHPSSF